MFPPVLRQGQKDLVTPAAPGAAPSGERPAPAEAGAETGAAERHRGSLAPRHAILEWMWEQPTGSGGVPVLAGSALSPKGGGLWPPALPARPQSEFFANPGGICLGAEIAGNLFHLLPCVAGVNQSFASEYITPVGGLFFQCTRGTILSKS